jgi:hypothetical protein
MMRTIISDHVERILAVAILLNPDRAAFDRSVGRR